MEDGIDLPFVDSAANMERLSQTSSRTIAEIKERLRDTPHAFELASSALYTEKDAINIGQEAYGVTSSKSDNPLIGTQGASECTGIILYDKTRGIAAAGHFDASINPLGSIEDMIRAMGSDYSAVEAYVWGAVQKSPLSVESARRLTATLDKKRIKIAGSDLLNPETVNKGLYLDTRTGTLHSNVQKPQYKSKIPYGGTGEGFSLRAAQAFNGLSGK